MPQARVVDASGVLPLDFSGYPLKLLACFYRCHGIGHASIGRIVLVLSKPPSTVGWDKA